LVLEKGFEDIISGTTDLEVLGKLDENVGLQDLRDGMKDFMLKVIMMECRVEKKREQGVQTLKPGWRRQ
jgi:hypothetical protein